MKDRLLSYIQEHYGELESVAKRLKANDSDCGQDGTTGAVDQESPVKYRKILIPAVGMFLPSSNDGLTECTHSTCVGSRINRGSPYPRRSHERDRCQFVVLGSGLG
jgi:hypothetical protein